MAWAAIATAALKGAQKADGQSVDEMKDAAAKQPATTAVAPPAGLMAPPPPPPGTPTMVPGGSMVPGGLLMPASAMPAPTNSEVDLSSDPAFQAAHASLAAAAHPPSFWQRPGTKAAMRGLLGFMQGAGEAGGY